jgi:hypothetical protein
MNFERIRPSIDVDRMQQSHVTIIGGAFGLAHDLVRCGVGAVTLIDFDVIDATNPARQDLYSDFGRHKAEATAADLLRINRELETEVLLTDFCSLTQEQVDELLGRTDLLIDGTDSFPVHARANREAIRLRRAALWIGLYQGARAGEIIHYIPDQTPACYRCICSDRYRAYADAGPGLAVRRHVTVSSAGGTILDLHLVDAIAGQIAVGILTRGAENRFGQIIPQLGNRNLLQVKIDPTYCLGHKDIFRQYLGDHPANFSFTTIALPMEREPDCPDCRSSGPRSLEPAHAPNHATNVHP